MQLRSYLGFPCGSAGKESACIVGDLGSIPGLGRSPGEGNVYTGLSDFHFHFLRSYCNLFIQV